MAVRIPIISDFADAGIRAAEKAFGKLGKTGVIVGAALTASTAAVTAGLVKSVFAAAEDQKSQALLAKQLQNTVGASDQTTKATEAFIGQMELASGVADDILRPALGNLVRATGDVKEAQDLLTLAQDISSGTGKDLESVSTALAKASLGQFTALVKLGIPLDENVKKTKDFTAIQKALDAQFSGASATAAETFSGQLARLGTVWDNLTESIGYAVLNNVYVKDAINLLPDAASNAIAAIGEKGLSGALGVFLDQMGIVGAYAKRFGISVALAYNNMAADGYNAITLLTLGTAQLVPAFKRAGQEINDNLMRLGLELDANTYYIDDLNKAMKETAAQTKATAIQSERWALTVERLGGKAKTATTGLDGLGAATKKLNPKVEAMKKKIQEASTALQNELSDALEKAKTRLSDAETSFADFGKSVSSGIKSAFSFQDAKEAGKETGADFINGLRDQVRGIQDYSKNVSKLLAMGLSQEALQAVLDAGGESGAAIAAELIKGGQTAIDETNALVGAAQYAADSIALQAANKWYGAGVSNAQAYLDGVAAAFNAAQIKLGSPNLNLADIKGISASFYDSIPNRVSTQVEPVNPYSNYTVAPTTPIVINVTGGISTSAEIGEAVVNAIRAYNRAAGPANITIA
jgi:hypothetical protein